MYIYIYTYDNNNNHNNNMRVCSAGGRPPGRAVGREAHVAAP